MNFWSWGLVFSLSPSHNPSFSSLPHWYRASLRNLGFVIPFIFCFCCCCCCVFFFLSVPGVNKRRRSKRDLEYPSVFASKPHRVGYSLLPTNKFRKTSLHSAVGKAESIHPSNNSRAISRYITLQSPARLLFLYQPVNPKITPPRTFLFSLLHTLYFLFLLIFLQEAIHHWQRGQSSNHLSATFGPFI